MSFIVLYPTNNVLPFSPITKALFTLSYDQDHMSEVTKVEVSASCSFKNASVNVMKLNLVCS